MEAEQQGQLKKFCQGCGAPFWAGHKNQLYCGRCRGKRRRAPGAGPRYPSRPLTEDTPFLVQKWVAEGMSEERVAKLLYRCPEDVREAMRLPLPPEQRELVEEARERAEKRALPLKAGKGRRWAPGGAEKEEETV